MYENDKVDIKGSILIELSGVLHTSPNYLLGMEDYENKANRIGADETTGDYELGTLIKKCRYPQKFHEHH